MFHLGLLTYLQTTAWGDVVWSDPPGLRAASRRHLLVSLLARSWNLHALRFKDGGDFFLFGPLYCLQLLRKVSVAEALD